MCIFLRKYLQYARFIQKKLRNFLKIFTALCIAASCSGQQSSEADAISREGLLQSLLELQLKHPLGKTIRFLGYCLVLGKVLPVMIYHQMVNLH